MNEQQFINEVQQIAEQHLHDNLHNLLQIIPPSLAGQISAYLEWITIQISKSQSPATKHQKQMICETASHWQAALRLNQEHTPYQEEEQIDYDNAQKHYLATKLNTKRHTNGN